MTSSASTVSPLDAALALHRQGRLAEAEADYRRLLAQSPRDFNLLQLLGTLLVQQQRHAEALPLLQTALAIDASLPALQASLATALAGLQRYEQALFAWEGVQQLKPADTHAASQRALLLQKLGRPEQALLAWTLLLDLKPADAAARCARSGLLQQLQRHEQALADTAAVLEVQPEHADALLKHCTALLELGRCEEALASADTLIKLQPRAAAAWYQHGNALRLLRRHTLALASFETARRLDPRFVRAIHACACALQQLGRIKEALHCYEQALALRPDGLDLLQDYGEALLLIRRHEQAAAVLDRVLALSPDQDYAESNACQARLQACSWDDLEQRSASLEAAVLAGRLAEPFLFLGLSDNPAAKLACARSHSAHRYPATAVPLWRGERYPHERIRVAYVSADFRVHPVAFLIAELFELHTRADFELYAFALGPPDSSPLRQRIRNAFDHFIEVHEMSDAEVAALLREHEIDIAVDLMGYTLYGRPGIFARRPAPVQVSYLGFPGTLGAPWMDYIVADAVVIPPGAECHYSEQVLRLPHSYQVNDRQREIAPRQPSRTEAGLPEQSFVFCCFNTNYKVQPGIFALWLRLLQAVEGSVLWLFADSSLVERNLRRRAEQAGLAPERLFFAPRLPLAEHMARLRCADLFLDTLPYNAHTTASDALWAGLPVLTCTGASFASRVATSLLLALELPELVTASLAEYEARALQLARNPAELAALRQQLAARRLSAPLFDTPLFTRHLETAFRHIHGRSQQGLPPQAFTVAP